MIELKDDCADFAQDWKAKEILERYSAFVSFPINLNGKRVNVPSYQLRPGDIVEVAAKAKEHLRVKAALESTSGRGYPEWLEVDANAMKGTFKALPQRSELPSTINESLVVELYSK